MLRSLMPEIYVRNVRDQRFRSVVGMPVRIWRRVRLGKLTEFPILKTAFLVSEKWF